MKTVEFTVQDSAGLYARPASILTKAAAKYTSAFI
ncbi:HPr family phosphocarrier protein [Fusibacter sp. JL298sf-3]